MADDKTLLSCVPRLAPCLLKEQMKKWEREKADLKEEIDEWENQVAIQMTKAGATLFSAAIRNSEPGSERHALRLCQKMSS